MIEAGHNPMDLRKGLEAAAGEIIAKIDKLSEKVAGNKEKIAQVATISAGDAEIGNSSQKLSRRLVTMAP